MNALHINGNDLTLEAVREVAVEGRPVLLAPDAREAVDRARAVVERCLTFMVTGRPVIDGAARKPFPTMR